MPRRPDTIVHIRPGQTEVVPGGDAVTIPPRADRSGMPGNTIVHIAPGYALIRTTSAAGHIVSSATGAELRFRIHAGLDPD